MTLKEMIEATVQKTIADVMADMMGETDRRDASVVETSNPQERASDHQRSTRKRGRGRNKVAYVRATHKGRNRDPKDVAKDLPAGNVRLTWTALVNAKAPISALELEKKTGLGKKAVESAVWALRNAGLVKSQPVAS